MDGDHRPDLVMTGRALANNGSWTVRAFGYPAAPFWEVYRNLGDGFDPMPDAWFLPLGGPPERGDFGLGVIFAVNAVALRIE